MKKLLAAIAFVPALAFSSDYTGFQDPFTMTSPSASGTAYTDTVSFNVLVDGTYTITVQGQAFRRTAHSGRSSVTVGYVNNVTSVTLDGAALTESAVQYQPIGCAGTNLCYPYGPTSYYTVSVPLSAGKHVIGLSGTSWASNSSLASYCTVSVQ